MLQGPIPHPTPHSLSRAEDPLLWLRLIRSRRIYPVTFHKLLAEHGGVEAALAALPEIARAAGVDNYAICPMEVVRHEMTQGRVANAQLLLHGQPGYPVALMDLPDAPPILWAQGRVDLLAQPAVALVGARNASSLGLRMARRLASSLGAAGQVIVSGLARGIDAESHQAALETGTIAVQAGGVDVIYPVENTGLALQILEKGCRVSEQPMGMEPQSRHFPARNRIISGLVRAVVVVEAAERSGSLTTARDALDQGREVLAVPGHPFDARAAGCNQLIRDGATLVRGAQDVLEALSLPMPAQPAEPVPAQLAQVPAAPPTRRSLAETSSLHSQILARLGPSPLAEDQLIRDLDLPSATVTGELLLMEMEGVIHRQAGGLLSRS
jgi:DNA processing protein